MSEKIGTNAGQIMVRLIQLEIAYHAIWPAVAQHSYDEPAPQCLLSFQRKDQTSNAEASRILYRDIWLRG